MPFFLLTANLMNVGGITDRLVRLSRAMVGNFPGALAQINVLLSVFFAGISGSSTADAASQGKIFIEAQVKEGYDLSFSIAITAVSAVLAVIIPPSILMIVWGGVISVSIGALYLAGVVPGPADRRSRRWPPCTSTPRSATTRCIRAATLQASSLTAVVVAVPALFTPFIIVGGILLGWFTADGVRGGRGALRGRAVDLLLPRDGPAAALARASRDRTSSPAIALFCVGTASAFGWLLAYYQIPQGAARRTSRPGASGITGVGFFIAFVFLVVGCFLDAIPAIIIVGTTLQPLAASVGMHPVPFAIIGIVVARVRAGHPALRPVPDDLVRDRQGAAASSRSRTR